VYWRSSGFYEVDQRPPYNKFNDNDDTRFFGFSVWKKIIKFM